MDRDWIRRGMVTPIGVAIIVETKSEASGRVGQLVDSNSRLIWECGAPIGIQLEMQTHL